MNSFMAFLRSAMSRFLVRICLLRAFSVVSFTAFLIVFHQWPPLLGDHGLTPVNSFLDRVAPQRRQLEKPFDPGCTCQMAVERALDWMTSNHLERVYPTECLPWSTFTSVPSVLWFVPRASVDVAVRVMSITAMVLSVIIFVSGACSCAAMFLIWLLYLSLISVGQEWYSFGWEMQLCETAFLLAFACPWRWEAIPMHDLPLVTTWALRWLSMRVMLGSGLIKLRGDPCWRDLSCMNYFYQTQPVPNPFVGLLHRMPSWWHQLEVFTNHFVECVAPFYFALPQPAAAIGAGIQIGFQLVLICSGNFSFLNWLTVVPAIAGLEDRYIRWAFTRSVRNRVTSAPHVRLPTTASHAFSTICRLSFQVCLALIVAVGSVPVVQNLLSETQSMNTSFSWLKLVNTYGNFGSVTRERNEVAISGFGEDGRWYEYEFHCKPGNITKRPCIVTPYHYRVDWMMWFASFSDPRRSGWLLHLAKKMLASRHDHRAAKVVKDLVAVNPFRDPLAQNDARPRGPIRLKLSLYRYDIGHGRTWWNRRKLPTEYLPELREQDLIDVARFFETQ